MLVSNRESGHFDSLFSLENQAINRDIGFDYLIHC